MYDMYPEQVPMEFAIPFFIIGTIAWFVLGSAERREKRRNRASK